ncbi:hypothetical protein VNO78_25726 [Psophocarpus tetragonolobus]|uniref:Uncharacterized protein n=1 Tax=Psophocarpus tetragonolobus TaxID=3891 RepID=A0AAN9S7F4_PSOTE
MGSGHPMDCETHTFADISEQFYRNIISTVTENDWTVELEVQFLMVANPNSALVMNSRVGSAQYTAILH